MSEELRAREVLMPPHGALLDRLRADPAPLSQEAAISITAMIGDWIEKMDRIKRLESAYDCAFEQAMSNGASLFDANVRIETLETAARTLIAKLDECAPHVSDAFLHREMRCGPYEGPNYAVELAALRAALSQQPPVEKQEADHGG